jgi:hypothetical protein
MVPETPPKNRLRCATVWRLHRFTRAGAGTDSQRSLETDVCEFFSAIIEVFSGAGHWMPATAPARGGGVDVWFKLPLAPADAAFSLVWSRLLDASGLKSQAISGRN